MYDVAFVGTGPDPDDPVSGESFAMAYRHAPGYERLENCDIVACADIVPENAEAFAGHFDIDAEHIYEDYAAMLAEADPDIVSICTPVPTHAPIVLDIIDDDSVEAIHCEKPMALEWGDAKTMAQEAWRADV
jgi:predicted dehydrogenase